jgi:hypothetical protein
MKFKNMKETLRDKIAIEFMKTIVSTDRLSDYIEDVDMMDSIASDAYKMADAMLKYSKSDK